jgi:hypothetical protein
MLGALLDVVPGGVVLVAIAWRAWGVLVGLTAVLIACWMVVGVPALEQSISRRDSLKPFALGVAARRPPPEPLAFWDEPVRSVAVYLGRPVPTIHRAEDVSPGLAVIATETSFRALAQGGVVSFPLLTAEGRIGNEGRGHVALLETSPRAR